ncbi:MAG: hypothetical protein K2X86_18435 [Cytophagaceae bacterium]|nr:hypothetical protein [Cytophagaceae bacterium]
MGKKKKKTKKGYVDPIIFKEGFFKSRKEHDEFWKNTIPELKKNRATRKVLGIDKASKKASSSEKSGSVKKKASAINIPISSKEKTVRPTKNNHNQKAQEKKVRDSLKKAFKEVKEIIEGKRKPGKTLGEFLKELDRKKK